MDNGQIILILVALVAANLPFFTERFFFVIKRPGKTKHFGWQLLELFVLYFLVGGVAYLLESRLSTPHQQKWEFYAITACLFLVFAYPGFVVKYLWSGPRR
ncbi:MAG: DUF2818 family protein [Pseudomonadota bacterium]